MQFFSLILMIFRWKSACNKLWNTTDGGPCFWRPMRQDCTQVRDFDDFDDMFNIIRTTQQLLNWGRTASIVRTSAARMQNFHQRQVFISLFIFKSLSPILSISGDPDGWLQNAQHRYCAPVNWEAMWFQPSVRDAYGGQRDLGVGDRFWRWFWRFHPYFYVFFWQTTRLFTDFFHALFPKVGLYLNFNLTGPAHRASGFLKII